MDTWTKIEEIVRRFSEEITQLGPQFTSICAVHDSLNEQSATQGVGLLDGGALLQLFASMTDTAADTNQWTMEEVDEFLAHVGEAVRLARSEGSEAPWPLL
ncbi:MAG: hypothetical protein HDQ87_03685 [Clostridia bacterium]|nr:hypothetical protein [Clostridia bacterium]